MIQDILMNEEAIYILMLEGETIKINSSIQIEWAVDFTSNGSASAIALNTDGSRLLYSG